MDNGSYLFTSENFKSAHFLPERMDRARHDIWEKEGCTDLFSRTHEKTRHLLKTHTVEPKPEAILKEIDQILIEKVN